jgi:hypothetical protein
MQRLHYTGDSLLVPDAVCDAIFTFASALAGERISDVVRVPIVDEAGVTTIASILIGPASQLYATPAPDSNEIDVDPELVEEILRRAGALTPSRHSSEHRS